MKSIFLQGLMHRVSCWPRGCFLLVTSPSAPCMPGFNEVFSWHRFLDPSATALQAQVLWPLVLSQNCPGEPGLSALCVHKPTCVCTSVCLCSQLCLLCVVYRRKEDYLWSNHDEFPKQNIFCSDLLLTSGLPPSIVLIFGANHIFSHLEMEILNVMAYLMKKSPDSCLEEGGI